MEYCKRLVEKTDALVYSPLHTSRRSEVTCGVGAEIDHALKLGIPVYELKANGDLQPIREPQNYLSYDETIVFYGVWRDWYGVP